MICATDAAMRHLTHYQNGVWRAPYQFCNGELFELHEGAGWGKYTWTEICEWRQRFEAAYSRLCSEANFRRTLKGLP